MHKDLHSRLTQIAEEQDNRAEHDEPQLTMDLHLEGGFLIRGVSICDGSNGLDDDTMDVAADGSGEVWVVPIARIVTLRVTYPETKP